MRRWAAFLFPLLAGVAGSAGLAKAQDSGEAAGQPPYVITADTLSYDPERDVVTASGDVEISSGERRLLADRVRYDQAEDKVYATGNVVLLEPSGDALFGDEVELTGNLRDGFVESVGILLDDDSRVAAARGIRREGNVIELERATYSPCPLCAEGGDDGDGGPLWQIKARRAIYDERAQTVTYRDARMELFGVPVAYTPWFRHTAPGVERQSGFLTPTLGSTSELGFVAEIPYHYVLSPSADFTVAPLFTQNGGTVLGGEYRRLHQNGYTFIGASGTYAEMDESDLESERSKDFRGHVKANGAYGVTEFIQAGYDVFLTTDDTYLDRYQIADDDVLRNRLYVEGVEDRDYWAVNGYYFQGLRPFDDQDTIPVALPLAEAHLVSDRYRWGSYFTLDSDVLALTRSEGLDTRRVSNRLGWTLPHVGPIGDVYRLNLSLRGDVYNTEGDPQTFSSEGGGNTTGRVLPRLTVDWSWPLADATGGSWAHEVEPMVSLNVAPTGGNSDEIPNEDSTEFEFDETNLFEPIRFPGLDVNEGGTKVAYGLRFTSLGPRATEVSGIFGQSYALTDDAEFPAESGLREGFSDYVGAVYLRPSPLLDLSYRFRLGRDDLRFRRSDALAVLGPAFLRFNLGYLNLSREPQAFDADQRRFANPSGFDSREEVVLGVRAQLTERLAVGGQTRRDLSADQTVANQIGVIYTHPCLVLAVGFEQRFTPDAELGDETVFLFRISFENLGEFETGGGLFGSE